MPSNEFTGIVAFLKSERNLKTQTAQANALKMQQPLLSRYRTHTPGGRRAWKNIARRLYAFGYAEGKEFATKKLMTGLIKAFGEIPQSELAESLHVTQQTVSNWMRGMVAPSTEHFASLLALHVIRLAEPIVEFHPILPIKAKQSEAWRFFEDKAKETQLRLLLKNHAGIYLFYDSAGRVTYLGKTESCLWSEPKQRLKATVNRPFYNPTRTYDVKQGAVSRYLSAYRIRVPEAIHNLEVLMLRAIPNDSANTNVGKFKAGL